MEFNTSRDAIKYLTENNLEDIPVSLELHLNKKPKIEVWYGTFEFGRFNIGTDYFDMCVINAIDEKTLLENDSEIIENYMLDNGYESWFVPSECSNFEIVYSDQYVRDNNL